MKTLYDFSEIWMADFEYSCDRGEMPKPICLVAKEYKSKKTVRIWEDELLSMTEAPFENGADSVFVAYYSPAEFSCFHSLGWALPANVFDLFTEFRAHTNGRLLNEKSSLLAALKHFGFSSIESAEKDSMRDLALRGGPWTEDEKRALLEYCESDVEALDLLLPKLNREGQLAYALQRGRYMKAVSEMEGNGIPINLVSLKALREMWPEIQDQLIIEIDRDYGVYEGKTFKSARFAEWLRKRQIAWPRLESGQFDFKEETFREMSRSHPEVAPIKELRSTLSKMRLNDLAVGGDSRNRTMLSPLRSKTGRNQPSSKHFIFGPAVWLRGLIKPREGYGIAYIDWSQQEFGTAAALSGDEGMLAAYQSDDPYLSFAKQAGAVPANATKESHGSIREQFKACVLAVQYGMGEVSLASRIGQSVAKARELLDLHLRTYPVFWKWSDSVVDYAMFNNELYTVFGWNLFIQENPKVTPNDRSIRNFPMQANGAEMLRLACCLCVENGITVCAPVHDALLIEAPLENLDDQVKLTQELMAEASRIVLGGFSLKSDADIYRFPERYMDKRGEKMWEKVWGLVDSRTSQQGQSINQ